MGKKAYLVCVKGVSNNNKYYNMEEEDGNTGMFYVTYGRVGASAQKARYWMCDWDKKYNEKLRKGYRDVTNLHVEEQESNPVSKEAPIANSIVARFVEKLRHWSGENIRESYQVGAENVTQRMIDQAQAIITRMHNANTTSEFNGLLEELAVVIPRRMSSVRDFMASTISDMPGIITREQNILNNMAAKVKVQETSSPIGIDQKQTILEQLGLTAESVTDTDELNMIKGMLGHNKDMLKEAFRVSNKATEKRYQDWKTAHKAKEYLYFHGSRRENFFSIWSLGLNIQKYALYGMFGKGSYFANKAEKSLGYVNGGYWRGGTASDERILSIFGVAYANQMDLWTANNTLDARVLKNRYGGKYDAVFAHAGQSLRNDEIIVYDDAQSTIRYMLIMK